MNRPAPFTSTLNWSHDVFISFRGEDTRYGFVGNLHHALTQEGIRTFIDDQEIQKGEDITQAIHRAIEESRMAIVVFSENYASSTFCLNELVEILQCIKGKGRPVWPIFYDVEASDVRNQRGSYAKAMTMHQNNFKLHEAIQSWKIALHKTANLKGLYINPGIEYEYKIIQKIVKEISDKVKCQNEIFASNDESLKWDPMECEYDVTCHKDSPDQRDSWLRLCFNLFTFVASLCPSS